MKNSLIAILALIAATALFVFATQTQIQTSPPPAKTPQQEASFRQVDSHLVCMINDQFFGKQQIPVKIGEKTYYGCCSNCEKTLKRDPSSRMAVDPVSGNKVDKATAVIGADSSDKAYYFENETNLLKFSEDQK